MTPLAATPSQTVGPFFHLGLAWLAGDGPGAPGGVQLAGRVSDGAGAPVPDAVVELHSLLPGGSVAMVRCLADEDGGYRCSVPRPAEPGGGQAPHLAVTLFARGLLNRLVTRCYLADDAARHAGDPVLGCVPEGRRHTLVATEHGGVHRFDLRLQGPEETVFLAW